MKKAIVLSLGLFLFAPSLVFSNTLTLKIGLFFPTFKSDLWETEFDQMDFKKSDYYNTNFGFSFDYFVTRQLSLVLSIDSYSKNKSGYYKGYVGYLAETLGMTDDFAFPYIPDKFDGDYDPNHSFNVTITPIQASLKLLPLGRKGKFIPYVGGGIGVYIWNIRLLGDMIDFNDEYVYTDPELGDVPIYPINPGADYTDVRENNRFSIGYHALGGVMIPVANRTTLELEFKYNLIKGDLKNFLDFEPFDLGGYQLSVGINYWF